MQSKRKMDKIKHKLIKAGYGTIVPALSDENLIKWNKLQKRYEKLKQIRDKLVVTDSIGVTKKPTKKELQAWDKRIKQEFKKVEKQVNNAKIKKQKPKPETVVNRNILPKSPTVTEEQQELQFIKNILYDTKYAIRIGQQYFVGVQNPDMRLYLGVHELAEVLSVNIPLEHTEEEMVKINEDYEDSEDNEEDVTDSYSKDIIDSRKIREPVIKFDAGEYVEKWLTLDYQPILFRTYADFEQQVVYYANNYVPEIIDAFELKTEHPVGDRKDVQELFNTMRTTDMWDNGICSTIYVGKSKRIEIVAAAMRADEISRQITGKLANPRAEKLKAKIKKRINQNKKGRK